MDILRKLFCEDICNIINDHLMKIYKMEHRNNQNKNENLREQLYSVYKHVKIWNNENHKIKKAVFSNDWTRLMNKNYY